MSKEEVLISIKVDKNDDFSFNARGSNFEIYFALYLSFTKFLERFFEENKTSKKNQNELINQVIKDLEKLKVYE